MSEARTTFCMDMGTTTTRAWVLRGTDKIAGRKADFGLRDLASERRGEVIDRRLPRLLAETQRDAEEAGVTTRPNRLLAAGMIGAPNGLAHVPHVVAPAGVAELRSARVFTDLSQGTVPPLTVVPGVRIPAADPCAGDVIRGEECLCMGLAQQGLLAPADAVLNLGSHWKWIGFDEQLRIERSRTSLGGEMIHVVQAHTLLASGLPQERPRTLHPAWLERGSHEAQSEGLSRALFCVRLLEQQGATTAEERLSFLYGAFLQQEMQAVLGSAFFRRQTPRKVIISGSQALALAWSETLRYAGVTSVTVLSDEQTEEAYLRGLVSIAGDP